jgi:hypothetical protein
VPVVGLATWSLLLGGTQVDPFPVTADPDQAAQQALAAALTRVPGA